MRLYDKLNYLVNIWEHTQEKIQNKNRKSQIEHFIMCSSTHETNNSSSVKMKFTNKFKGVSMY